MSRARCGSHGNHRGPLPAAGPERYFFAGSVLFFFDRLGLGAAVGLALLLAGLGVHERGDPPARVVGLAGRLLGQRVAGALGLGRGLLRRLGGLRVRSHAEQQHSGGSRCAQ